MTKHVVGIRFKKGGRIYYFNPGELELHEADGVIVETARGMEFGEVALAPRDVPEEQVIAPLKDILRIATAEDHETHTRNSQLEQEAFSVCQEKINQHNLEMKLVDVEYTFNGSKITFFFTSEGRVDFRDLVKDLAFIFKTRIELRQIGVRDEAKMLGGLGSCGRSVCCKTFLEDFQPVSIKMAKEQKLSLSPTKISGLCGRLMCCLKYEQDAYESMRKLMPKVNKEVITVDGKGLVLDNNAITECTKVRVTLSDGTLDIREYHFSDIRKPGATPEEDSLLRKELQAQAQEKAREAKETSEEHFRFVTGAAPITPAPPQPEGAAPKNNAGDRPPRKQEPRRRSPKPNSKPDQNGGGKQPEAPRQPRQPQENGGNEKSENAKPRRNHRRGRRPPRKPGEGNTGNGNANNPPARES